MRKTKLMIPIALIAAISLSAFTFTIRMNGTPADQEKAFPEEVNKVIEKSCVGCHSTTSQNEKAKEKLDLKAWNDYSVLQKVSNLKDIKSAVSEGNMPPSRFLERYPDRKLTEDEVKQITSWVDAEIKKIVN